MNMIMNMKQAYHERIAKVREMMDKAGLDAVVISGSDPHCSEYPAPRWQQVKWLSGFTGEAAQMIVTGDHAGLWTDSRYFIQAQNQLEGTGVQLHKLRMPGVADIPQWLAQSGVRTVGIDGLCHSVDFAYTLEDAFREIGREVEIIDLPDMLDVVWKDRPMVSVTPISLLDEKVSGGLSRAAKLEWLRGWMKTQGVDGVLFSSLDEIAWLLNVRGGDIEYNPLVISYLLVTGDRAYWFARKYPKDMLWERDGAAQTLEADGVEIMNYDDLNRFMLDVSCQAPSFRLFTDPSTLSYHTNTYCSMLETVLGISPVILKKAVREASEAECLRKTFVQDGLAMERFLYWIHTQMAEGRQVSEWEASEKLTSLRAEIPGYRGNSFENISAYGPNAALPHYVTPKEGSAVLRPSGLYLVDSGGQYLTGTTDITRTVPLGPCSDLEKEDYTLVLKGMIDLSMAVFPEGTAGCQIDALARMPLWKAKRNFGHGTGHGIGYYLCVHEGPQSIRYQYNPQPLLPGMVTSNEPAIYREGMHGIRHENIVLCRPSGESGFGKWLDFETLTVCHIDTSAVLPELLGPEALRWLNDYNAYVYRTLAPMLEEEVAMWLEKQCAEVK